MKIVKRNGSEVEFDIMKIIAAIGKANEAADEEVRLTPMQIRRLAESVVLSCEAMDHVPTVEEVQDLVEYQIMAHGAFEVARSYIRYRYTRQLVRISKKTGGQAETETSLTDLAGLLAENGEKPQSFSAAVSAAVKILVQEAAAHDGSAAFPLADLVPYVAASRELERRHAEAELREAGLSAKKEQLEQIAGARLARELREGIAALLSQTEALIAASGRTPELSVRVGLAELPEGPERDDLRLLAEELLLARGTACLQL